MAITSKQRAFLKKMAHDLDPIVRIGKDGVSDNLKKSILDAINSRELIKIKILQNCEKEKKEVLEELNSFNEIEVVGMIGGIITVYKENKDKPVISEQVRLMK